MINSVSEAKRLLMLILEHTVRDIETQRWVTYLEDYIVANTVAGAR